jgi:hypothetical protein
MPQEPTADPDAVAERAELLPEERAAGSDDPEGQAEAILGDSEARTLDRDAAPDAVVERRTSEDVVEPQP